jgi:hypothetical protein
VSCRIGSDVVVYPNSQIPITLDVAGCFDGGMEPGGNKRKLIP